MNRSDFKHCVELPVRWGDMDSLGHVNNVQYLRYLESGRVAYVEQVVGSSLSLVLADIQCAFRQQLHYPVTIEVLTRISRLGRSSLDVLAAIYRQGEDQPVATSKGVIVWFDFREQRPAPIPEQVRKTVLAYETVTPDGG